MALYPSTLSALRLINIICVSTAASCLPFCFSNSPHSIGKPRWRSLLAATTARMTTTTSESNNAASAADPFSFSNWRRHRFSKFNARASAAVCHIPPLMIIATSTTATLATSTSLATNETASFISAFSSARSAVSAQLQNQPQRSINIQPSAQQFIG